MAGPLRSAHTLCIGFQDKLFWRQANGPLSGFHCFKKTHENGWVALCGRAFIPKAKGIGGQAIRRPETHARCGRCDGLEMARRGWTHSGPASGPKTGFS